MYRHQWLAYSYLEVSDAFALFMEQGTGKTRPMLWHMGQLLVHGEAVNALVVCPKAVIDGWKAQMDAFPEPHRTILQNRVTVINYDMVWRRATYDKEWDIIVLDEAHAIRTGARSGRSSR